MLRELKFRVWDRVSKKMHGVDFIDFVQGKVAFRKMSDKLQLEGFFLGINEVEIMQFTGLRDKNRKEIYEGDVLRSTAGLIGRVRFAEGSFVGSFHEYEVILSIKEIQNRRIEVIGNIYEDPDLY